MKSDKEILERVKRLCESVVALENSYIEQISDDHIETCEIILNLIKSHK